MINTDAPNWASETAVLTVVVVLPSPGCPLVTRIIIGGPPALDSITDVLNTRYASATDERDSRAAICPGIVTVPPFALFARAVEPPFFTPASLRIFRPP